VSSFNYARSIDEGCECTTCVAASRSGGRISDLPNPDGSGTRIQVRKEQVQHYTWRSYGTVGRRFQESVFVGFDFVH